MHGLPPAAGLGAPKETRSEPEDWAARENKPNLFGASPLFQCEPALVSGRPAQKASRACQVSNPAASYGGSGPPPCTLSTQAT